MPFRKISADLKERALHMLSEGWLADDVVDVFGVSQRSLQRWTRNLADYDSVVPPPMAPRGRPPTLTADQLDEVLDRLGENATEYIEEILDWLAIHRDTMLSRSQLKQKIKDAGYTYKLEFQSAFLRADMCVCVDESSKDNRTLYRHYGWAPSGQRPVTDVEIDRGQRFSMLPALSVDGYIALRVVPGSVNGPEFFDFIVHDVLPQMNPYPAERSVLILDNCAIHKSELLREVVEAAGVLMVFIPPYSPEFNPIEESFHVVKSWLRRNYRRLLDSQYPEVDIYEACQSVTPEKARGFFAHAGYEV